MRSKKIIDIIAIADNAPVLPSSNVLKIAKGRFVTIPEKIIIEIPLPKPFSVRQQSPLSLRRGAL